MSLFKPRLIYRHILSSSTLRDPENRIGKPIILRVAIHRNATNPLIPSKLAFVLREEISNRHAIQRTCSSSVSNLPPRDAKEKETNEPRIACASVLSISNHIPGHTFVSPGGVPPPGSYA
jgi:hypothetical protein